MVFKTTATSLNEAPRYVAPYAKNSRNVVDRNAYWNELIVSLTTAAVRETLMEDVAQKTGMEDGF